MPSPVPSFIGEESSSLEGDPPTKSKEQTRKEENQDSLAHANVKAFLSAISQAEGGDYDLKYGGVKGKKNDKWRITDYSTHPGAGYDGKTTAAGMYQINKATWKEMGGRMGLTDFSAQTQDLLAVEILRTIGALNSIVAGNIDAALKKAAQRWNALPQGPKQGNRVSGQPHISYEEFIKLYKSAGGSIKN
ncbi:glycoside hydrolase family 104 protein [Delftia tsuruhatensis]|uniref:glycoside hydrolase family 24 protein n=1 Tax=Delftia tsuruhatensis TaxID=180282 RepID=UPI001F380205|nr:glycoside hydrolase family 104 protein [Delftia tsuruhatensis]